ncbi:hypothetical protein [Tamlana flava]|uniref:hypothetical protein n=1 Tax=Tamlana flava TaxID=3158572 RepID=UPI00351AD744
MYYYLYNQENERYDRELKRFLNENNDKNEVDFLNLGIKETEAKIKLYENITDEQIMEELRSNLQKRYKVFKTATPERREQIIEQLLEREYPQFVKEIPNIRKNLKNRLVDFNVRLNRFNLAQQKSEEDLLDLSDAKGTEKIIMLKLLGIFDFLKSKEPFSASTNALAAAISGFTGIKVTTVQSYINPINNINVDQKNNPLRNEKAIQKVKTKLASIGFNPSN